MERYYYAGMRRLWDQITLEVRQSGMDHCSLSTELCMTHTLPWKNALLVLKKTGLEMKLDGTSGKNTPPQN